MGPVLPSLQTSTWLQAAAKTGGAHLAFGDNRPTLLQGHRPDMAFGDSTGQELTMTLGGITATHIRLFLTSLESPILPLSIVHTSFCFCFSSSPSLAHLSGTQGLWMSAVVSGVLCPTLAMWNQTAVILGLLSTWTCVVQGWRSSHAWSACPDPMALDW